MSDTMKSSFPLQNLVQMWRICTVILHYRTYVRLEDLLQTWVPPHGNGANALSPWILALLTEGIRESYFVYVKRTDVQPLSLSAVCWCLAFCCCLHLKNGESGLFLTKFLVAPWLWNWLILKKFLTFVTQYTTYFLGGTLGGSNCHRPWPVRL